MIQQYDQIIKDQKSNNIIEKVILSNPSRNVFYLPHHLVITPSKQTTKIRMIYNASAKSNNEALSLNESLYRGLVMSSELCGILLRLRSYPYGVIADIKKAFLQTELHEKGRDMTRFLWLEELFLGLKPTNLEIYQFGRIAFGFIPSPFLLTVTVAYYLRRTTEEASSEGNENRVEMLKQIQQQIHVDN